MLPALVLTAGFGTRLDPVTRLVAKPAVPMGNRTLIEHVLAWLRREQVPHAVLNLHYLPATITGVVGDGRQLGVPVRYSWEQPVLGSAGGPRRALSLLESDQFLIVNGDTLCDFALDPMLEAHTQSGADVTMALIPNPDTSHYNGIQLSVDNEVLGFVERGHSVPSWHFTGVQIVRASVFAGLPDGVRRETVAGIYRDMIGTTPGRIKGWRAATSFLDVGTPRDYLRAAIEHRGAALAGSVPASARLVRSFAWPEAIIGRDVILEDCIVAGAVTLPRGFHARSSILVPASLARPGDRVEVRGGVAVFPLD